MMVFRLDLFEIRWILQKSFEDLKLSLSIADGDYILLRDLGLQYLREQLLVVTEQRLGLLCRKNHSPQLLVCDL